MLPENHLQPTRQHLNDRRQHHACSTTIATPTLPWATTQQASASSAQPRLKVVVEREPHQLFSRHRPYHLGPSSFRSRSTHDCLWHSYSQCRTLRMAHFIRARGMTLPRSLSEPTKRLAHAIAIALLEEENVLALLLGNLQQSRMHNIHTLASSNTPRTPPPANWGAIPIPPCQRNSSRTSTAQ